MNVYAKIQMNVKEPIDRLVPALEHKVEIYFQFSKMTSNACKSVLKVVLHWKTTALEPS